MFWVLKTKVKIMIYMNIRTSCSKYTLYSNKLKFRNLCTFKCELTMARVSGSGEPFNLLSSNDNSTISGRSPIQSGSSSSWFFSTYNLRRDRCAFRAGGSRHRLLPERSSFKQRKKTCCTRVEMNVTWGVWNTLWTLFQLRFFKIQVKHDNALSLESNNCVP